MGEPNAALSAYMNRPDRIRSVLEYYLGQKLPGDWRYEEIRGLYTVRNTKGKLSYRQRDLIGKAWGWGTNFLLGLENQERINLTFPWRLMEMDCLAYREEIEEIRKGNREGSRAVGQNFTGKDDFLYRYREEDRIKPVLNLMLYWGKKQWERPRSLQEMTEDMSGLPLKLQQLAGDYKVHIIHMRQIPEEAIQQMDSDLKYVLGLMKRTRSPKKYADYIRENREYFARMPRSAVDVLDVCTNIKNIKKYLEFAADKEEGEEEADMCYALDQIQKEAEKKGKRKGKKEGIQQGKKEGKKEGIQQGIQQMNELVRRLLEDGRQEDLLQATGNAGVRQRLLREYGI